MVVTALAVTGLVGAPWFADRPAPIAQDEGSDPLGLFGLWQVDAAGETPDTVLWLGEERGEPSLRLRRPCGSLTGSWFAGDTVFAGTLTSWAEPCVLAIGRRPTQEEWTPTWLESAITYSPRGQGWQLYDAAGTPVAMLRPGAPLPQADLAG